jgi:hypothetical protein
MSAHCGAVLGATIRMAFVLVSGIELRRLIGTLAIAACMSASALIPSGLTQSNPAPPAEPRMAPAGVRAEADRQKFATGREEAARAADAAGSPSGRRDAATEQRKRALIILMFQNGANTPFGFFKQAVGTAPRPSINR